MALSLCAALLLDVGSSKTLSSCAWCMMSRSLNMLFVCAIAQVSCSLGDLYSGLPYHAVQNCEIIHITSYWGLLNV